MLGVHGAVGDGRVEPQPVPLLAVVERALELRRAAAAAAAAASAAPTAPARSLVAVVLVVAGLRAGGGLLLGAGGLLGGASSVLLGASGLLGLELGGDQRVVLEPRPSAGCSRGGV